MELVGQQPSTSISQSIAQELSDTNVTSTVLCPGAVATGFVAAGDPEGNTMWDNAATPGSVAKCGYEAMMKSELVKINPHPDHEGILSALARVRNAIVG